MNCSFFPPVRVALLGAALVGLTASAPSAAQVQSGVLECNVAPGVGFIIGSSKTLSCVFHPARGRPEYYASPDVGIALGAGGSANTLVGGYGNSISLRPLSGTTTGLNLSAGIGALTLQPVAIGPPRRRQHHG